MAKPLLPPASALTGDERVRVGQAGEARLASAQQLKDFVGGGAEIAAEAKARRDADTTETAARAAGDKTNADAITAEAGARAAADKTNSDALAAEVTTRVGGDKANADAIVAEAGARTSGDKANSDALTAEAKARSDADAAMQARLVTLSGTLTLAAGLSLVVGKTDRKVAVVGLKRGDGISVTPTVALPGNMTLGDAYCLADGELSLSTIVTGTLALSISAKTDIPLIVKALR